MDPGQRPFLGLPGPMGGRYELPDLEELREAMTDEEHWQFMEGANTSASATRRSTIHGQAATLAEIAAAGVQATPTEILHYIREEEEFDTGSHAAKKARVEADFTNAYKVFENIESGGGAEEDRRRKLVSHENLDVIGEQIEEFWFEMQSNKATFGLGRGIHLSKEEFHKVARPMVEKITKSTYQWRVKEWFDLLESGAVTPPPSNFKLFDSLCTSPELIIEVCKHLRPRDIINLYSMSRQFHDILDGHMQSSVMTWARSMAPSTVGIFHSALYRGLYIKDPAGRPVDPAYYDMKHLSVPGQAPPEVVDTEVRLVPSLKWLDMVVSRHRRVRDILATLARMGHRLPAKMHITLKKMWLVMDIATNVGRYNTMRNKNIFKNEDIYLLHFFVAKLAMAFNDPIYGPESPALVKLMLGQRGLSPLWAMLRRKKYTTRFEIRQLKVAYDVEPTAHDIARSRSVYGVPVLRMGRGHTEGWGLGNDHLTRPDEFLALEVARRQMEVFSDFEQILLFGHVNLETLAAETPTLDEMYMSDDEKEDDQLDSYREAGIVSARVYKECGNVPFEPWMWQPRDLKRKDWENLSLEERSAIEREEKEEFSVTFDPKTCYYNYSVRTDHLENLWTVLSGEADTVLKLPTDPMGKVDNVFDPLTFARWGDLGTVNAILGQFPDDEAVLEPPADWEMNWKVFMGADDGDYTHFLLDGEADPFMDGDPYDDAWDEDDDFQGVWGNDGHWNEEGDWHDDGHANGYWDEEGDWHEDGDEDDEGEGEYEYDEEEGGHDEEEQDGSGQEGEDGFDEEGEDGFDEEDEDGYGEEEYGEELDEGNSWEEDADGDVEMADAGADTNADDVDDDSEDRRGLQDDGIDGQPEVASPNFRAINLPFRPQGY